MSKLEAVIFDLDGVLTETSHQHFLAWRQLAHELGFELCDAVNERLKGISRMESLDIVLREGGMQERFSEMEKTELAERKNQNYKAMIQQFTPANLSPGALELLKSLKENNIKVGLASVSHNAMFLLSAMGIHEYFDAIADPQKIKHGKPAPDIFLAAAELLEATPVNCVGIEDAYAGIEAIKSARMAPLGIGSKEQLYNCEKVVESLAEVDIEFLKRLLEK